MNEIAFQKQHPYNDILEDNISRYKKVVILSEEESECKSFLDKWILHLLSNGLLSSPGRIMEYTKIAILTCSSTITCGATGIDYEPLVSIFACPKTSPYVNYINTLAWVMADTFVQEVGLLPGNFPDLCSFYEVERDKCDIIITKTYILVGIPND